MILVSSWSRLWPIIWSQVLSPEWRCGWGSADKRCSNYIWVIDNLIAYQGASYIGDLTVGPDPCGAQITAAMHEISCWWNGRCDGVWLTGDNCGCCCHDVLRCVALKTSGWSPMVCLCVQTSSAIKIRSCLMIYAVYRDLLHCDLL